MRVSRIDDTMQQYEILPKFRYQAIHADNRVQEGWHTICRPKTINKLALNIKHTSNTSLMIFFLKSFYVS